MSEAVWDASALLTVLHREPGWQEMARELVESSAISSVNVAEVVAKLAENGMPEAEIRRVLQAVPLEVHPLTAEHAIQAGLMRPATKSLGLSLGDRACLALARYLGEPALTTDRAWEGLELGIEVRVGR